MDSAFKMLILGLNRHLPSQERIAAAVGSARLRDIGGAGVTYKEIVTITVLFR
jgi:hypothetical protein